MTSHLPTGMSGHRVAFGVETGGNKVLPAPDSCCSSPTVFRPHILCPIYSLKLRLVSVFARRAFGEYCIATPTLVVGRVSQSPPSAGLP